jgi:hypothetical protein
MIIASERPTQNATCVVSYAAEMLRGGQILRHAVCGTPGENLHNTIFSPVFSSQIE